MSQLRENAMKLSEHFTLAEFVASQTATRKGINNDPPVELYPALRRTADGLERIRVLVGGPIVITSGYRSKALNSSIGGAVGSQHVLGEAADIRALGMEPSDLARLIDENRTTIQHDQLILEYPPDGWVHVSFTSQHPRMIALTATRAGYLRGLQA